MKFSLEIGDAEKHVVEYDFNQLLGRLVITVNRHPVKQTVRLFSEPVRETHCFTVGEHEQLTIRIEKERQNLYGQINRVFVNNRLLQFYRGV